MTGFGLALLLVWQTVAPAATNVTADPNDNPPSTPESLPAAEEPAPPERTHSVDEIAVELVNPVGSLFSVGNQFEYRAYQGSLPGAGDRSKSSWIIEPVFPFVLRNGRRIVLRARLPHVFGQPTYAVSGADYAEWRIRQDADVLPTDREFFQGHSYIDDMSFDVAYGGIGKRGSIAMIGIAGQLPTSDDGSAERDQHLLGPDAAYGKRTRWGIIGARLTHLTNLDQGSTGIDYDINETSLRVFFAYGLGRGWQAVSNPVALYDWEGAPDNRFLLPLGGGVSKTLRVGAVPLKTDLEVYRYMESPDAFGSEWLVTLRVTPVVFDRARE